MLKSGKKILVLGGYGNFGKRIVAALARAGVAVIIAGRSKQNGERLIRELSGLGSIGSMEALALDGDRDLGDLLASGCEIALVINAVGPFQAKGYEIPRICIVNRVNYLDLGDGREYVTGITKLDHDARRAGVLVVSGASTLPGLSSAVLEHYRNQFAVLDSLQFGISPGQRAERGLATTTGVLSYVGKKLAPFAGCPASYGWQDIYRQHYPEIGARWMANCDVPDLDLLVERYRLKKIKFSAGLELSVLHLGLWLFSWIIRLGVRMDLVKMAPMLLRASNLFNRFGSADGGMHMVMSGTDHEGRKQQLKWFIIAKDDDGPQIPTVPAIILAKKLLTGELSGQGAKPCVAMVTLKEYLNELEGFAIKQYSQISKK